MGAGNMAKASMGITAFFAGVLGMLTAFAPSHPDAVMAADNEPIDSPRLAALDKALKAGDSSAIDRFWEEMQGKSPLIEPVSDDPHMSWVTFIWRGDAATYRVNVLGGPSTHDFAAWMTRLGDTDLWYRTDRIASDARFVYRFQVNRPLRFPPDADKHPPLAPPKPDPLNPRQVKSMDGSLAELPAAPPEPWLEPANPTVLGRAAPKRLSDHSIHSEILKQDRRYSVYTPADYDAKKSPCGLLLLFDAVGSQPNDLLPVPNILNYFITRQKLPEFVAVLVHQKDRMKELSCSPEFADFVATELVPRVRADYHLSGDPSRTIVGGISQGGLMAAYCGYRHSEVFGNVLSLSGAFQWMPGLEDGQVLEEPGWLTRQFVAAPRLPVRFYLAVGSFENYWPFSQIAETRRFRDVLRAKGYAVEYQQFSGGHEPVGWRRPFVDGLITLGAARPAVQP